MSIRSQTLLNFAVAAILMAGVFVLAAPAEATYICVDNIWYKCTSWGNYLICEAVGCCI